jgi:hypothetical protein
LLTPCKADVNASISGLGFGKRKPYARQHVYVVVSNDQAIHGVEQAANPVVEVTPGWAIEMNRKLINMIKRRISPPLAQVHPSVFDPLLVCSWHVWPGLALKGPWPGFTDGPQWQHEFTALHPDPFEEHGAELATEYLEESEALVF